MATDNKVDVQVAVSVTGQQDLGNLSQQLDATGQQAQQLGQQAQGAGGALGAAGQGARDAAQGMAQTGNAAQEANGKLGATRQGLQSISEQLAEMRDKMGTLGDAMKSLFAASQLKNMVVDTIALADAYGQMAERIKMATPVAGEYDLVQRRILESANLTYRPLAEQQELYIRTADALRSLTYSTGDALDITDSFSYLLTTNAASSDRAANAIGAYTKSIQSGRVDAESWQSIMAATPTIVDAIAKAAGKTAAEIRQMGVTGNLSVRDLTEGLRQSVEVNKQAAAGMSATVHDAVTHLANAWQDYVGKANQASGATKDMVKLIDLLSANLDTVVSVAIKVGEAVLAMLGIKALAALKTYTVQLALATEETLALAAATDVAAMKANKLGALGNVVMAGWLGWEIGTWMSEKFETVRKAGIFMVEVLVKGAAQVQNAWELVQATFSSKTYAQALANIDQRMKGLNETFAQMYKDAGDVAQVQDKVAAATQAAGNAAQASAARWDQLQKMAAAAGKQIAGNIAVLEKDAAARNAEAQTAVRAAQAFGTEQQQRTAAAHAAQVQADTAQGLLNARRADLAEMQRQREAIMGLEEGYRNSTKEVKDQLEQLNQSIPQRQAEVQAAAAQAGQYQIAAAQAQVQAQALKDNSERVDELRAARDKAGEAFKRTIELHRQGKASLEDVSRAEIEAGKAAAIHRDAIEDLQKAISARAQAEAAGFDVQEMGIRVAMEQHKRIYEVCKARGDEAGAIQAQNELRELEIQLMQLQAQAKRAEAAAQLAAVQAKRAELEALGPLTDAQRLQLDAATKAAQVKQMEGDIADITARKLRDLAQVERESGRAAGEAAGGHERNANAMSKEAAAADRLGESVERIGEHYRNAQGFSSDAKGNAIVQEMPTWMSLHKFVMGLGLSDEQARAIADQAFDARGNYSSRLQKSQMRSEWDSIDVYEAARRAAEKIIRANPAAKPAAETAAKPAAQAPAKPADRTAVASSGASSGYSRNVNVNLSFNGRGYGGVDTSDRGAASIQAFMRALEDDARRSGARS